MLSFSPRDVLGEIWDLVESVSEDFPSYSFIFDCLKTLGKVDYTNFYPILKPYLKIVYVQIATILSKIIFLLAKSHMHIFNMLITSLQSLFFLLYINIKIGKNRC